MRLLPVLTAATLASVAVSADSIGTYIVHDSTNKHSLLADSECRWEQARIYRNANVLHSVYRTNLHAGCNVNDDDGVLFPNKEGVEVVTLRPEAIEPEVRVSRNTKASWSSRALEHLHAIVPQDDRAASGLTFQGSGASHAVDTSASSSLEYRILSLSEDAIVMAVSPELLSVLDRYISFDTRILLVDFRPLSGSGSLYDEPEKPEPVFKKPKFNTVVDQIASSSALSEKRILKDLRILTGEDPQPKDIGEWHSRHSSTYGARRAAQWIKQQLEASLSSINGSTCSFFEYSPYFAPNVVCHIPAADTVTRTSNYGHELPEATPDNPDAQEGLVLVSAHLDSRGTFGSTTAPGGDDDGSGTGALLAIARAIGNAAVQFASPVQLVAFSGEEQGLVGSQKYAKSLRDLGTPVKLALQMDMLAYRKPGEPLQLAFPDKLSTKSATAHVSALAELYAPQLTTGFTPACCSDHQSFWEQGFPATWVFERNGPIADPMYHNSGDLTNRTGYDTEQLAAIAKVVTATLLNVAGFYL